VKLFFIKVGRNTRRGSFQVLFSRAVSVSDNTYGSEVYAYFRPRYEGFEIQAQELAIENLSEKIPESKPAVTDDCGSVSNFTITYTEAEKQLDREYHELREKAESVLRKLHNSISARYSSLPYVNTRRMIELETGDQGYYGTICKKLYLKSSSFFKVLKDGVDGTEELKITEDTGGEGA